MTRAGVERCVRNFPGPIKLKNTLFRNFKIDGRIEENGFILEMHGEHTCCYDMKEGENTYFWRGKIMRSRMSVKRLDECLALFPLASKL